MIVAITAVTRIDTPVCLSMQSLGSFAVGAAVCGTLWSLKTGGQFNWNTVESTFIILSLMCFNFIVSYQNHCKFYDHFSTQ